MRERVEQGVWGAVVGAAIGSPFRGQKTSRRLSFYEPIPVRMEANEALDFWPLWLEHLEAGRGPLLLSHAFRTHAAVLSPELGFGAANLDDGIGAPLSGSLGHPLAEGAQAVGRAPFWGLAFPGQPELAAGWAWADSAIDHAWDGVWMACFAAEITSRLEPGAPLAAILKDSLKRVPPASALHRAMPIVVRAAESPDRARELLPALPAAITLADPSHAVLAVASALAALLSSQGRFERAVCTAAGCGGPADQAAILAGVWAAIWTGGVPKDFTDPLGTRWVAGSTLRSLQPPTTLNTIIERLAALVPMREHAAEALAEPEPEAAAEPAADSEPQPESPSKPDSEAAEAADPEETAEEPAIEAEADAPEAQAPDALPPYSSDFDSSATELDRLEIRARFLRGPACAPGQAIELEIQFKNLEDETRELYPELAAPSGWEVRSRLASHRLMPGEDSRFPVVVRPSQEGMEQGGRLNLEILGRALFIPVLPEAPWLSVGPFVNHDGAGFDREFLVESKHAAGSLAQSQSFGGRSDLPVAWRSHSCFGPLIPIEELFRTGPGVVYLWSKWVLPKAGRLRAVCSASNGARLWINRERVLHYHQEHVPHRRPSAPYVGQFVLDEPEAEIFIKLTRGHGEVAPLAFYLLDDEGRVIHPSGFRPMAP
jgi:hypothetical protein